MTSPSQTKAADILERILSPLQVLASPLVDANATRSAIRSRSGILIDFEDDA